VGSSRRGSDHTDVKLAPVSFDSILAGTLHLGSLRTALNRKINAASADCAVYGCLIGEAPMGRQCGTRPHFTGR
jgi:hypothetical protein